MTMGVHIRSVQLNSTIRFDFNRLQRWCLIFGNNTSIYFEVYISISVQYMVYTLYGIWYNILLGYIVKKKQIDHSEKKRLPCLLVYIWYSADPATIADPPAAVCWIRAVATQQLKFLMNNKAC